MKLLKLELFSTSIDVEFSTWFEVKDTVIVLFEEFDSFRSSALRALFILRVPPFRFVWIRFCFELLR